MLKKSITYTDFNDEEVTEDHYFHLSQTELVEMQFSKEGGLDKHLQKIIDRGDGAEIMATFKKLILDTYGRKSDDGKRFEKTPELRQEFAQSAAYSALFMELCTNADAASDFINGLIPRGLAEEVSKIADKPETPKPLEAPRGVRGGEEEKNVFDENETGPATTPAPGQPRVLSRAEVTEMDSEELSHLLATGQAVIGQQD